MPNTEPAADCAAVVRRVLELAKGACTTCARRARSQSAEQGRASPPWPRWPRSGVRIFTDDGIGRAGWHAHAPGARVRLGLGVVVADHCEEASLAGNGCMNEGEVSSLLGLPGRPGRFRGGDGAAATLRWPG